MILIDTNVISEPLKASSNRNVLAWIDAQIVETLYLSTISLAELCFGIEILPDSKRRDKLQSSLEQLILPLFIGRILAFDVPESQAYARLCARTRAVGQTISLADGFIAAIAMTRGFAIATRDTLPFEAAGLDVINPWKWKAH